MILKKVISVLLYVAFLIPLISCNAQPNDKYSALQFASEYKKALFEVAYKQIPTVEERTAAVSKYVSDEALNDISADRIVSIPLEIARAHQSDVRVKDVSFSDPFESGGKFVTEYSLVLVVAANGSGKEQQVSGNIQIEKREGDWKVTKDFVNSHALSELVLLTKADRQGLNDKLSFVPGKSVASYAETEAETVLVVEFTVVNESGSTTDPFAFRINIADPALSDLLEQDPGVADHYMGQRFTLLRDESHVYGSMFNVKDGVSAEKLRAAIEGAKSLEVRLINEAGEVIASQWIQKFRVLEDPALSTSA
ncbi:hypothetical protein [Paenibacillus alkalitolerans]|uniref:hypothetical protein n=1 Tax=Paenibacillus alkalitolerans TaxID=2799335 RepID=UPI0018F31D82|nr:hypothetical protein [Paenibacillus alkalitolerans]